MQFKKYFLFTATATCMLSAAAGDNTPVYLDKTKPIEERVEDALSRMMPVPAGNPLPGHPAPLCRTAQTHPREQ